MNSLDISTFDLEEFDLLGSSVQKCFDDAFGSDYFNLDIYDPTLDDSELSVESDGRSQKRKRSNGNQELQQQFKLSRPRIVKSDFRRNFAQMWAGVFNSTDFETMTGHIRCFYDDNVSVLQNDLRPLDVASGSKVRGPFTGHEYLSTLWYRSMQIAPDQVCVLKHTYVKVRSDGTSSVKCTFGLEGTKVVKVEDGQVPPELQGAVVLKELNATSGQQRSQSSQSDASVEALADELDRFISTSSDSADESDSSLAMDQSEGESIHSTETRSTSTAESTADPLQQVLHRYLKASDAVARSKAHAASEGGRKRRRKRAPKSEFAGGVAVDEWLSASSKGSDCASSDGTVFHDRPIQYATIVNNNAYIRPVAMCTLRGDNDRNVPIGRSFQIQRSQKGDVILTSPLQSTCSLELNFNADHKIVSVTINYIE